MAFPLTDWNDLKTQLAQRWRQGDHVSILGPTGSGKTTLALNLLPLRKYVVVLATKPKDPVMEGLRKQGYALYRKLPIPAWTDRVLYWPKANTIEDVYQHRKAVEELLKLVYTDGGWTLYVDEVYYVSNFLRLETELRVLWTQGRSLGVTLVALTQRPRLVPLEMYDQASHLFIFRFADDYDLKRLASIASFAADEVRTAVRSLERHQFLYLDVVRGEGAVSRVDL